MNGSGSPEQCSHCEGFCTLRHRMTSKKDFLSYLVYIIPGIFLVYCVKCGEKLRMKTFPLKIIGILTGAQILARGFIVWYLSRSQRIWIQLLSGILISGQMLVSHLKPNFKGSWFSIGLNSPATSFRSQRENLQSWKIQPLISALYCCIFLNSSESHILSGPSLQIIVWGFFGTGSYQEARTVLNIFPAPDFIRPRL